MQKVSSFSTQTITLGSSIKTPSRIGSGDPGVAAVPYSQQFVRILSPWEGQFQTSTSTVCNLRKDVSGYPLV